MSFILVIVFLLAFFLQIDCFYLDLNNRAHLQKPLEISARREPSNVSSSLFETSNSLVSELDTNASVLTISRKERRRILKSIISIAIPALAACIAEPLLTLVDTFSIGRYSGSEAASTRGLAALAVCGSIFNIVAAVIAPLCTSTTGMVAYAKGRSESTVSPELFRILLNGLSLAVGIGLIINILLLGCRNYILAGVFGLNNEVLRAASQYLVIRSFSLPSLVMNYVITGYSLGTGDMTPAIISIVSGVACNVFGDWLLVAKMGQSVAGAALATVVASYAGSILSLSCILGGYKDKFADLFHVPVHADGSHLQGLVPQPIFDKHILKRFFTASALILAGTVANTLTYSSGSRIASFVDASQSAVNQVAAQQVAMQIWWFLSFFISPLSLAAQALLPTEIASKDPSLNISKTAASGLSAGRGNGGKKHLLNLLLRFAALLGVFCSFTNVVLCYFYSSLFTNNEDVIQLIRNVTPQAGLSQMVLAIATALDGIVIGTGLLQEYCLASFLSTGAAWLCFLFCILKRQGIRGYWNGLLVFSLTRFLFLASRLEKVKEVLGLK